MALSLLATRPVPRWFWPLVLGLNFLLHLPFFALPPNANHSWRQCNTMAVARNFAEESLNILRPRVDRRGTSDGVTGMQFPAYEWGVAALYRTVGFHESIPRVLNWLLFAAGVVACFGVARQLGASPGVAAVAAWSLAWSPELFYHAINALPDILALTASLGGLYFFLRWYHRQGGALSYAAALALTVLAGLTKLQYLAIGAPIAVLVVRDAWQRRLSVPRSAALALFAVVAVAVPLRWYAYALHLIQTSGLADFGLELRPAESVAAGLKTLRDNLISDLPELLVGYSGTVLLALGLVALARGGYARRGWFAPLLAWAALLLAYHIVELRQMDVHQYYMLPYLPLLALGVALGASWLSQQGRRAVVLLAVLLLAQPVVAALRIIPARWLKGAREIPAELFNPTSRVALENAVPNTALCVVGPDVSGCKFFYFLHKKGFGFSDGGELFQPAGPGQPANLTRYVKQGARYLYTNDSTLSQNPGLRPYVRREVRRVGAFQVLELQMPAN